MAVLESSANEKVSGMVASKADKFFSSKRGEKLSTKRWTLAMS